MAIFGSGSRDFLFEYNGISYYTDYENYFADYGFSIDIIPDKEYEEVLKLYQDCISKIQ